LLAATLYQGNPDRNHKLWNIVSTERYILHIILKGNLHWLESDEIYIISDLVHVEFQPTKVISPWAKTLGGNNLRWVDNSAYPPPSKAVNSDIAELLLKAVLNTIAITLILILDIQRR
jgi:hypothetical protein